MRNFFESTRLNAYLALFRCFAALELYDKAVSGFEPEKSILIRILCLFAFLVVAFLQALSSFLGLFVGVIIDISIWCTALPVFPLLTFLPVVYSTLASVHAHVAYTDETPRNSTPLDLFRFKGKVLLFCDRCCIFLVEDEIDRFDEVFRVFRIISSIESSVYVARTRRVVLVYNSSPSAKGDEYSSAFYLPIPKRCDIRFRSWLIYSVTICNENSVHNGLVNIDTFRKMALAINDCYNVWDNGYHFSVFNLTKNVVVPLVPAITISTSYRVTNWPFLEWVGENEVEIFFGIVGSISLIRILTHGSPIWYERLSNIHERTEQVARVATIRQNDASPDSTAWHINKTYGSIDCQIKNGMEALMLAFIVVYEVEDEKMSAICLDRQLEYMGIESEARSVGEQERPHLKRTLLLKFGEAKSGIELNDTVKLFNELFDANFPRNVWLGRPYREISGWKKDYSAP